MNLGQIRSLVKKKFDNKLDGKFSDSYINDLINEALKEFLEETLLLEATNNSLTYNSSNDGFVLPSDFIQAKYVEWTFNSGYTRELESTTISEIKRRRNVWAIDNESVDRDALNPSAYTIHNGHLILDTYTQTSPKLYYYKYDSTLSNDTDSPSISTRFHKYLADYVCFELDPNKQECIARWQMGLQLARNRKQKTEGFRTKYIGL